MVDWSVGPRRREVARKRRVLVVDDDEVLAWFLKEILEDNGLVCDGLDNPQLALIAFRMHPYDIVVVDPKMQEFDGMEFLRVLRRFREGVPVVLITAFLTRERLGEFMKLGAVDCLIKPFESGKLIDAIWRGLHILALREELRTHSSRALDLGPCRGALRRQALD